MHCKRGFSAQSFSTTYYLKRPELQEGIVAGLVAGSAHRQISRSLGCAHTTVTRQASRLGRHMLLFSAEALWRLERLEEGVVADHFESFVDSQFDPVGIATAVGSESWYVYTMDPAPHGRSGRVTAAQRRVAKRRAGGKKRTPKGGYVGSHRRVIDLLLSKTTGKLDLTHDDHPAYRAVESSHPERDRLSIRIFPNPRRGPKGSPRSLATRARDAAMFPVDLLHGIWRHTCAHHRRETIAFSRRLAGLMERAAIVMVWRNFRKLRSERNPVPATPAMHIGLADRPYSWARILAERLFPERVPLPEDWVRTYRRDWPYPDVGFTVPHDLKHAY